MTPDQHVAADLAALADLPAMHIMRTGKLIAGAAHAHDSVGVEALLHGLAERRNLRGALRAWALLIGELGPPRLPGGALVEDAQTMRIRGVGIRSRSEPPWLGEFRAAMDAARDRDGVALFASIDRAFEPNTPGLLNYSASFATSALHLIDTTSARPGTVAALHLIGHAGTTPQAWSLCGPLYRLVAALLAVIDMGGLGVEAIDPELNAFATATNDELMSAFEVISAVAAIIAGGDPREPLDDAPIAAHPDGVPAERAQPEQVEATRIADRMVRAWRENTQRAYVETLTMSDVALGVYGCANLFACRVYRLWGA